MDIHLPVLSGVAAATLIKIHNPFRVDYRPDRRGSQ
jgi:hypothetical protein